jgi:hypothetical protein
VATECSREPTKEQQLDLFAGRMSTSQLRTNQTRRYFALIAYVLMNALRRIGRLT